MKMFLSRIGENSKTVINGDVRQTNISGNSGLMDAIRRIGQHPQVGVIEFTREDIVRSGLAKFVIEQYEEV
jgi:phosphate starvation-inducible PhoH-like protein